ncbi:MAG: hypothetical protein U0136_06625 [Bdellovibrionota bacterium]
MFAAIIAGLLGPVLAIPWAVVLLCALMREVSSDTLSLGALLSVLSPYCVIERIGTFLCSYTLCTTVNFFACVRLLKSRWLGAFLALQGLCWSAVFALGLDMGWWSFQELSRDAREPSFTAFRSDDVLR